MALLIILVALMGTLFSEKMPISTRCIHGFISNLIKKPWTVSIKDWGEEKIAWKVVLSFTWKWISTLCRPSTVWNNWNICLTWHLLIHEKSILLSNLPNQGTRNQKLLTKVNSKSTIRSVMSEGKKLWGGGGKPVEIGGHNLSWPPPVRIGLTDLQNIGGPVTPLDPRFRYHWRYVPDILF